MIKTRKLHTFSMITNVKTYTFSRISLRKQSCWSEICDRLCKIYSAFSICYLWAYLRKFGRIINLCKSVISVGVFFYVPRISQISQIFFMPVAKSFSDILIGILVDTPVSMVANIKFTKTLYKVSSTSFQSINPLPFSSSSTARAMTLRLSALKGSV